MAQAVKVEILEQTSNKFDVQDADFEDAEAYLTTLIQSDGSGMENEDLDKVLKVLLAELSCKPFQVARVMTCLIRCLSYSSLSDSIEVGNIQDIEHKLYNWTIKSLVVTVELMPQSMPSLLSLLEKNPILSSINSVEYDEKRAHLQISYVINLLRLCSKFPNHRREILEIVIHFILKVDLRCPREYIFAIENKGQDLFIMDRDDVMVDGLGYQLDLLMEIILEYIRQTCFDDDNKLKPSNTSALFLDLMNIFERIILPTYKCSHVPFIMFYVCGFKQELCETFLDFLWKKTTNSVNSVQMIRQIAVSYISSFLARSKFISFVTVRTCLEIMVNWMHKYIDQNDSNISSSYVNGTFYAVCQAVAYVIAFLHTDMLQVPNTTTFLAQLNLMRIVTCQLNPLKHCTKEVVEKFSSVLKSTQIAFCDTLIAQNDRDYLKACFVGDSESVRNCKETQLEMFFPFDPYLLKRSKRFIADNYREYSESLIETTAVDGQTAAEDNDFLKNDEFSFNSFDETTFLSVH